MNGEDISRKDHYIRGLTNLVFGIIVGTQKEKEGVGYGSGSYVTIEMEISSNFKFGKNRENGDEIRFR